MLDVILSIAGALILIGLARMVVRIFEIEAWIRQSEHWDREQWDREKANRDEPR